jgi:hypothetical protein
LTPCSPTPPFRAASEYKRSKVGFPIRKSSDQSSFAAPQGLSQRTTSFIASQRQGIHRMLLRHLITLMIDVRRARIRGLGSRPDVDQKDLARTSRSEPLCLPNTSDQRRGHALAGRRTMSGLSDMFPLHDVKHSPATLTAASELLIDSGRVPRAPPRLLVEPDGIEPTTSCLQSTRSPN